MAERVCRAITASGIVPSTIVGRIRWLTADANAPCLAGQQRVDQHEAGDRREDSRASEMRPETGVQPSMPEKRMMSSSPHQKIGME